MYQNVGVYRRLPMKSIIIWFIAILAFNQAYAQHYEYEKVVKDQHVIHILKINSSNYKAKIVKANDGKIGRETVSSLATRHEAKIAINGGFFEIGGNLDGAPSLTLIIDGEIYNKRDKSQPLLIVDSGNISIEYTNPANFMNSNLSMVSGIPMLLEEGKLARNLVQLNSEFYSKTHARTAIGIDDQQNIVIVIAEHYYSRDGNDFTMGELKSLLREKGDLFAQNYNKQDPYNLSIRELREILKREFSSEDKTRGLTIVELANIMLDLGCQNAINLDGGGSSTLWIDGEVVNTPIGDVDENGGEKIERPVSDAILFVYD